MNSSKLIFNVDLTNKTILSTPFTIEQAKYILGGFGFNTWYLYKHLACDKRLACDKHLTFDEPLYSVSLPLSPENILIISPGLLTGSEVPASSRIHISSRSPLSNLMGSSNVGGHIGTRLQSINAASVVITGKASSLSYLLVNENGISIHNCEYLKGKDTRVTEEELRKKHQDKFTEILSIGVAGENLVHYACIMHGQDHAAGRTGLGAVMGSKNLKAIVVEGVKNINKKEIEITQSTNIAKQNCTQINLNPDSSTKTVIKEYVDSIRASLPVFDDFSKFGSAAHILPLNNAGQLGTYNYREGCMGNAKDIDGRNLKKYVKKNTSCHRCPVHCKAEIKIEAGRHQGFTGGRPEYETIINMGSLCGLSDPEELLYLSNFANILGIDTISTGSVIAFAMELFERGILTVEDTGGLELRWGDAKSMEILMLQIANQEGLGKILSQGVKRASEIIGKGSEKFAFHTKGVEIYGGDPRGSQAMALTYAISLRGGDFTSVYPIPAFRYSPEQAQKDFGTSESVNPLVTEGKASLIKKCLFVSAVIDSLGLCKVPALSILGKFDLLNESRLIKSITGLDLSNQELFIIGERIINMEKLFNLACGATVQNDSLPDIFQTEGLPEGAVKRQKVHGLFKMVQEFYNLMDWDKNGVPTKTAMDRLDI
ncbi:MAG: aldehyde ferredoxin oxidoreductase family protein [Desulfamplus sp.]|nr:aldehyde ferredoxin oxidoreductase family protein [Desulfamplus sp.]